MNRLIFNNSVFEEELYLIQKTINLIKMSNIPHLLQSLGYRGYSIIIIIAYNIVLYTIIMVNDTDQVLF